MQEKKYRNVVFFHKTRRGGFMKIDKTTVMKEVGERIRKIRMAKGLQQNQVSQEFECGTSKISSIEKGTRDPGVDFYAWFADRTDCSLDYIIRGKEDQRSQGGGNVPLSEGLRNALMALLDSFIESDDYRKYIVERQLVPAEYPGGCLTQSEIELIDAIRGMRTADAIEVMDHAKKLKSS
jgi:transcriptional regulator with XRE-family HTH domain